MLFRSRIFEIRPIKWLLEKNSIVICAGGGGIPTLLLISLHWYQETRKARLNPTVDPDKRAD